MKKRIILIASIFAFIAIGILFAQSQTVKLTGVHLKLDGKTGATKDLRLIAPDDKNNTIAYDLVEVMYAGVDKVPALDARLVDGNITAIRYVSKWGTYTFQIDPDGSFTYPNPRGATKAAGKKGGPSGTGKVVHDAAAKQATFTFKAADSKQTSKVYDVEVLLKY